MVVFPNAKINLGLNITERRKDGYHNLLSVFYPIALCDVLEFVEAENNLDDVLTTSGLPIHGSADQNLCIKALKVIREVYPVPPLRVHLHKIIPMGAGLGGGSADGSFFLTALNTHFKIGLSSNFLKELALELGSDCPFFIDNKPVAVSGRGDVMKNVDVNLKGKFIVVFFSDAHISTTKAYQNIVVSDPEITPREIVEGKEISKWRKYLTNDFEPYAFRVFPSLNDHKEILYNAGAEFAAMTGSGSAVFGIFETRPSDFPGSGKFNFWTGQL
ncbi:4-(cytidine 5'-diphospho)-2-C-methyl-D-erythritol kinase [Cryomorpha ignava]|uniref:4-diphosphocytidyl-2-C-methyl-D-erythritol kinase n=1 Tax=Cryomorpha ignava TaxID=101383 RepID=A0A7K3WMI5_9FLAO|nr:4-(cytidine 5'-diphospho)-2-C-methyl-D-erythritol kinase [Cryomorpha ignava]NEN22738.1 4-(cytidine 5'-diphospho)-2-C-methyl-D-erythritol kinase [Cryomorpha ignava]